MERVAVLGAGAMGSRMAAKLVEAGYPVTVWNRTRERAEAVAGAQVAESPRAAAADAAFVLSMVRDDDASREVWLDREHGALRGLGAAAIALECSTVSVPWVRTLAEAFASADRVLLDAPLAGSRPQAEAGQLIFFVGGAADAYAAVQPILAPMAGAVHHVGDHGAGATLKLMVNALLGTQLGLLAELIGFARRSSLDPAKLIDIISATPVCSVAAGASAKAMVAGAFAPAFPIDLVAKDLRLLGESAHEVAAQVPVSACVAQVYAQGVREGFAADNITGIVQLYGAGDERVTHSPSGPPRHP